MTIMSNNIKATNKHMKRIIITGTGRAGTTFIMKLLTLLDYDTGFEKERVDDYIDSFSLGGLEHDIKKYIPYRIIKSPAIMNCFDIFVKKYEIEKIIIPIRDLKEVAKSRINVSKNSKTGLGGLWGTKEYNKQQEVLEQKLLKFLVEVSKYYIPIVLISFERMFSDKEYLYRKLELDVDKNKFNEVYDKIYEA